jgi:hypothetical protein
VGTDFRRQKPMRVTTEDSDFAQRPRPPAGRAPGDKHLSNDVGSQTVITA